MQILYTDGDSESIFLSMERVRLTVSPGEKLAAPTADELIATAQHLLSATDAASDIGKIGEDDSMSYNDSLQLFFKAGNEVEIHMIPTLKFAGDPAKALCTFPFV